MALVFLSKPRYISLSLISLLICNSNWKWPDIPGLHSFKGDLIHSANWKKDYDLCGKRVAVLGCGSSGVQIVPSIQPGDFLVFSLCLEGLFLTKCLQLLRS